ncbi:ubiquitin fusion degradation protein [Tilletia horrida]|uniref:Ubiquitin fusion degradation protein n=1 Tax=Tilletia horrida TaxID=155126 RepID=A0AAN6GGE3_9BASI|nr:ubiquitin fusion degradation protein [Tilletia horrida]KAK0540089.1 ubiquitin fusion degradation protein [Tilletia horrida]KAK0541546.1 ubiquitin fusion degradation protein [Tilletia horrida]KAK0562029.1 ubiquitin fusion degradation protein [Tilletia horrida]
MSFFGGAQDPFGGSGDPFGGGAGGAGGLMGFGGGLFDRRLGGAPPRAFTEYLKAYSMAMLPQKERLNVSYGGKIIMPPSALAKLSHFEIASPWIFELNNISEDPKRTHAGVLEFIAEEGNVHLPAWMMRSLNLSEGDTIRIVGKQLPKGKLVKFQAQTVDFLEISDHRAVLEQAMRNFSTLTPGDIIEISYNCLTFELLVMEIVPEADGIVIIETDLEVDFAAPKGYVEPTPAPKAPPPSMASKLKIDASKTESVSGTSTPGAAGAGSGTPGRRGSTVTGEGAGSFKGAGQSLSGKKSKGKKERPIEALDPHSLVRRTDVPRVVTSDTQIGEVRVPAALNLPFGQLFFGYDVKPAETTEQRKAREKEESEAKQPFGSGGQTLSGRPRK